MTLSPAFNKDVLTYTATTTNATNKVTATPIDQNSALEIKVGDTEIDNEESATWEEGSNTLTVKSIGSDATKTYTVSVTKE